MALFHLVSKTHINENQSLRTTESMNLRRHAVATKIIGIRVYQEIVKRLNSNTLESNYPMSQLVIFWLQKCITLMSISTHHTFNSFPSCLTKSEFTSIEIQ